MDRLLGKNGNVYQFPTVAASNIILMEQYGEGHDYAVLTDLQKRFLLYSSILNRRRQKSAVDTSR